MKLKRLCSVALATTMAITAFTTVDAVGAPYASATDFITDVVDISLSGITSTTMDAAISNMHSKLSITDGVVSYNGTEIGYWDTNNSSTLYTDSSKSDTVIEATAEGYEISPSVLNTLLTDINNSLIENYVPTSSDWSKIIGKYDVTLGDITIPAGQWLKADSIETEMPVTTGTTSGGINLSTATGLKGEQVGNIYEDDSIFYFSWYIDSNGMLYIQDGLSAAYVALQGNPSKLTWYGFSIATNGADRGASLSTGYFGQKAADYPTLKVHLVPNSGEGIDDTRSSLMTVATMEFLDGSSRIVYYMDKNSDSRFSTIGGLRKHDDSTVLNTEDVTAGKAYGVAYFLGSQCTATSAEELKTEHIGMFNSCTTSKRTVGNQTLTRRLNILTNLSATDVIEVKASGWTVNGGVSIDQYLGTQSMINAGDTADINAVAEVEPMCFNVIVPTTLPIYVDALGVVSVADNASITNKSNSGVKLTAIDISAKAESGWTLVDSNPSLTRDAKEFTFTTSLNIGDVLDRNETKRFTYNTELSPITEGADSLDLATVAVTVDWAD